MNEMMESWSDEEIQVASLSQLQVPAYLEETYWWAYIHPRAVTFFEQQWVVNLILWGNFVRLRDAALDELATLPGSRTLQISCVYGNFSVKLAELVAQDGSLDIVDVLDVQLNNVSHKLPSFPRVRTLQCNSTNLRFPDASYDQAVIFFLLHEVPSSVKEKTLSEALRVLKPGGKLVIVDYHKPTIFHPLRYLLLPMLKLLEPFALDIWKQDILSWLPKGFVPAEYSKETLFGGLYQKVVIRL